MRTANGPRPLEGRLRLIVERLNQIQAGPDAFDDHAAGAGTLDLSGASWSARLNEDITHWELILEGRVVARVFAPFRGGSWRYEILPEHARPLATEGLVTRPLADVLRRLALQGPDAHMRADPPASRASSAQERLDHAEDAADTAHAAYRNAPPADRGARRSELDAALLAEAEARRESQLADTGATEVPDERGERRRRPPLG